MKTLTINVVRPMPKNIFSFLMKMIRIGSKEISSELESQLRNIEKLIQQEILLQLMILTILKC